MNFKNMRFGHFATGKELEKGYSFFLIIYLYRWKVQIRDELRQGNSTLTALFTR